MSDGRELFYSFAPIRLRFCAREHQNGVFGGASENTAHDSAQLKTSPRYKVGYNPKQERELT